MKLYETVSQLSYVAIFNYVYVCKGLAIKAEQQFDYVSGKNATDMALVIDTIELLHTNIYDAFVIVSSDSDYTPLAIKLHESGVYVMGIFSRGQSRISIAEPMGTQS